MKLLADASLPASIEDPLPADVSIVRYSGPSLSDTSLVRTAAEEGYRGLIMLGRDLLAEESLLAEARTQGVAIVLTVSDIPSEAADHLSVNIDVVMQGITTDTVVLVGKNGLRPVSVK